MKDQFTKDWIIANSIKITQRYEPGILTLRGLHYQLVSIGMFNTIQHYKRVVNAMIEARWDGIINFNAFSDLDREMIGETYYKETIVIDEVDHAKEQIKAWMSYYHKNRWENQEYYPEVFIEKKALQGVFSKPCKEMDISLGACKGYPSLTFLNDANIRFSQALYDGYKPIILYFGDYDPSGEDIPRSIKENMIRLGCSDIEVRRIALMEEQVVNWNLPPAPVKQTDTRSYKWDGIGQVELDAVEPEKLQELCLNAINKLFDMEVYSDLLTQQEKESEYYKSELKTFVKTL